MVPFYRSCKRGNKFAKIKKKKWRWKKAQACAGTRLGLTVYHEEKKLRKEWEEVLGKGGEKRDCERLGRNRS